METPGGSSGFAAPGPRTVFTGVTHWCAGEYPWPLEPAWPLESMTPLDEALRGFSESLMRSTTCSRRVRPRTETELRAGNLAGVGRTADRDMSDLGRLEDAFDELPAIPFTGLREQEATLQVNSSLGWKPDGKVHGCSSSRIRRRTCLADRV